VARGIADHFTRERLAAYPNVDGVVALTHGSGCGMDTHGEGMQILRRTLGGYAKHANFAGVLIVGLGCEANQISALLGAQALAEGPLLRTFSIQDTGGTAKTIARGIAMIEEMLPPTNDVTRESVSASHLTVGLQCGGSDGYSGITANPALGAAVDLLVRNGGTAILSETPEIYGAEHLLTRRAVSREIGEKLVARIRWWEDYTARERGEMNNNPSPGNKAGGLTTILEKSLGAVAKGGTTNLVDVYEYAEPVMAKGFVYMDTPGYDPVSATGQVAGGANMIVFTTGRGSAYGCAPAPSLKLATNTALWQRQEEDIDLNCGEIVDGGATVAQVGEHLFRMMIDTASGTRSKSELHGYGQNEFVPWYVGAVMCSGVRPRRRLTSPHGRPYAAPERATREASAPRAHNGVVQGGIDEARHEVRRRAACARHAGRGRTGRGAGEDRRLVGQGVLSVRRRRTVRGDQEVRGEDRHQGRALAIRHPGHDSEDGGGAGFRHRAGCRLFRQL
jgi:altronate hydrolase